MIFSKKQAARRTAARQHRQLMAAARHILSRHALEGTVTRINPAEIVALVFGRHAVRITEDEAVDYLNAALADRGYPLFTDAVTSSIEPVSPDAGGEA
ncbi:MULTISPECIES: hypothetical protein [unclassified Streptomyces]|uniref:hypothetical protein n=1 Tax=unclassified Streptomyces TaxID=2593676 RepID=UPI0036E9D53F